MNDNLQAMQKATISHCVRRIEELKRRSVGLPITSDERLYLRGKIVAFKEVLYRFTRNSKRARKLQKEMEHAND